MSPIAQQLQAFKFAELFNQLGWDRLSVGIEKEVGGVIYVLQPIAQKRGIQILHCSPDSEGAIPPYAIRQKIERKVTADAREHLIIFTDAEQNRQIWQWVSRATGRPTQYREVKWQAGQYTELLEQKLKAISFDLDEEERLTVFGVAERLRVGFDRDKVTKKFYKVFQAQRDAFQKFIDGIPSDEHQRWYTAVVIDRLMFLWFLQEKFFLDGDKRYLRNRLDEHLLAAGKVSFYKAFLNPLFFRGFAEERTEANRAAIEHEFGKVPYLNGGLFAEHELERQYGDAIDIPDTAFSSLFVFFDEWDWHLDDRIRSEEEVQLAGKSGEINPDVLGYIFEQFVNAKENAKGAYYTKEDITEYIAKNTIIPCLFEKVRADNKAAFDAHAWPLLQEDPRRYIYPAMLHGMDETYPAEIANGLDTQAPDLLERRKPWNKTAAPCHGLPTEIWRETIARHNRTREILAKLQTGEINNVPDLITYNLDIRQFAQDVIERCTDPALLRAFWVSLAGRLPLKSNEKYRHGMSVLDPTCGSGAFLFAALQILKPLYQACLTAMSGALLDVHILPSPTSGRGRSVAGGEGGALSDIDKIVERFHAANVDRMRDYAISKHIIVHNLYGVDIETQATEIAKLRLFLKLVALLEPGDDIEPLPDIDFNIRAGNTLVGYASAKETEQAVTQGKFDFDDTWGKIKTKLVAVEQAYNNFQIQQVQRGGHVTAEDKQALGDQLHDLEETLNTHLCREYGKDPNKAKQFDDWKASHKPFHWYVDFYPIMAAGGFDVVIGNPPYVEYSKVRDQYALPKHLQPYATNLYAAVCARTVELKSKSGSNGQIVPVSLPSTDRLLPLRQLLLKNHDVHQISFSTRPSKLFEGAEQRLTIYIQRPSRSSRLFSGGYLKWLSTERVALFQRLVYCESSPLDRRNEIWPKTHGLIEKQIFTILTNAPTLAEQKVLIGGDKIYYKNTGLRYFNTVTLRPPKCSINGIETSSSRETEINVSTDALRRVHALLLSSTFFCYYQWTSNCRDLNPSDIVFAPSPIGLSTMSALDKLSGAVEHDYYAKAKRIVMQNKKTGRVELESVTPRQSKTLIDEIDLVIGKCYGFTDEQLDYIINYDIKYRMGLNGQEDDADD